MQQCLRPGGTAVILETAGTGHEQPVAPTPALQAYYQMLATEYGFATTWLRTDYRFESVAEAEKLTRFFFGEALADRVAREGLTILPECTWLWWKRA